MRQTIIYYNIGWSGRAPHRRNVTRIKPKSGWPGFVERIAPTAERWGRIWLHNPFGALKGEPMQFLQRSQAHRQNLPWLIARFDWAVRRLTSRGVEVVAYVGSPRQLPLESGQSREAWLQRAMAELRPLVDGGCSIGFDATYGGPAMGPDSLTFLLIEQLRTYRIRVYCEPWARADSPHMFDLSFVSRESFFQDNRLHKKWAAIDKIRGEIVRLLLPQPDNLSATVAGVHQDGHTALVSAGRLEEITASR